MKRLWYAALAAAAGGANLCRPLSKSHCGGRRSDFRRALGEEDPFHGAVVGSMASPTFGHLDGDGILDALVGNSDGEVWLFRGQQGGGFERVTGAADPFHGVDVGSMASPALGDLDSDGLLDALVGNSEGDLWFFKGQPGGGFRHEAGAEADPFHGLSAGMGTSPAIADLDGDGLVDVAIGQEDGRVLMFRRVPGVGFQRVTVAAVDPFCGVNVGSRAAPSLGDLDGDGLIDALVGNREGEVWFFKGLPGGGFQREVEDDINPFHSFRWYLGAQPALGDFDGDGLVDASIGGGDGSIWSFRGRPSSSTFQRLSDSEAHPFNEYDVGRFAAPALGDADGDGILDAVVGNADGELWLFHGQRFGGFQLVLGAELNLFSGLNVPGWASPTLGDLDGDGALDALVGSPGGIVLFKGRLEGHFAQAAAEENPFEGVEVGAYPKPALGDVNGDGRLDVLVGNSDGQLLLFEGLPGGGFRRVTGADADPFHGVSVGSMASPALGDLDGDGYLDALVGNYDGVISFFRGQENSSFELTVGAEEDPFHGVEFGPGSMATPTVGDIDRDGVPDVAVGDAAGRLVVLARGGRCYLSCGGQNRGMCYKLRNVCRCLTDGFSPETLCSGCSAGFYGAQCSPCPGAGSVCSRRGRCHDFPTAREQGERHEVGNGTCHCTSPHFSGDDCSKGDCPAGQEQYLDGESFLYMCRACPPGSAKTVTGAGACLQCPGGYYASGAIKCARCAPGTYRSGVGYPSCELCVAGTYTSPDNSRCIDCPHGRSAPAGSSACYYAPLYFLMLSLLFVTLGLCVWLLPKSVGLPLAIEDISLEDGAVVVTTRKPHRILLWRWAEAKVLFRGTGDRTLDSPEAHFKVQAISKKRLALLSAAGEPTVQRVDTSEGTVRVPFPWVVLCTGILRMPLAFLIPGLLFDAAALMYAGGIGPLTVLTIVAAASFPLMCIHGWKRLSGSSDTQLAKLRARFRQKLRGENPDPQPSRRGPDRAVRASQLCDLFDFFRDYIRDRNMYYVCGNLVKPLTAPERLSYAEVAGPHRVEWFVSHFWGTAFRHLVESIRKHAEALSGADDWQQASYWICSLSNNQWEMSVELGDGNEFESSFYLALRSGVCKGTAMIVDELALPLTRVWCLFEVLQTLLLTREDDQFEGLLLCTPTGVLNYGGAGADVAIAIAKRLATLNLADAEATREEDRLAILRLVECMPGGFDSVNGFVRIAISTALEAMHTTFERDFQELVLTLHKSPAPDISEHHSEVTRRISRLTTRRLHLANRRPHSMLEAEDSPREVRIGPLLPDAALKTSEDLGDCVITVPTLLPAKSIGQGCGRSPKQCAAVL